MVTLRKKSHKGNDQTKMKRSTKGTDHLVNDNLKKRSPLNKRSLLIGNFKEMVIFRKNHIKETISLRKRSPKGNNHQEKQSSKGKYHHKGLFVTVTIFTNFLERLT